MQSLEILKQELITQKDLLDSKGFPVNVKNINPSPSEITEAIQNIDIDFTKSDAVESDVVLGKSFFSKDSSLKVGTLVLPDFESATATENTVMAGKTFYAGDNVLKTGTAEIPDLSETTATADDVREGKEFYNASGEKVAGTYKDMLQQRIERGVASYLFYACPKVVKTTDEPTPQDYRGVVNISKLDTSNVKDMSDMFNYFGGAYIDVSMLDTSKVTNMNSMFKSPQSSTTIRGLKNFNTSNVTNMAYMFTGYVSFENLDDIANWDVRNVKSMQFMFNRHQNTILDLSNWDTNKVNNMSYMFERSEKLQTVMGKLNLINVSNASSMFSDCKALTNLTLKNIKISLTIGSGTSWGHLLTLDSLLNTIKELWDNTGNALGGTRKLTIGTANLEKLANVYVKLIDITDEMRAEDEYIDNKKPFEVCESTDEGAMLVTEYVTTVKNWQLA